MRGLILPVLAAATLAGSAAPALAETVSTVVVPYRDLNLASPEGQQTLKTRIAAAVDTVCAAPAPRSLSETADRAYCRKTSATNAHEQAAKVIALATTVQVAKTD
jgi:UrcA family protein